MIESKNLSLLWWVGYSLLVKSKNISTKRIALSYLFLCSVFANVYNILV